jgi:hypothetical protein
MIPNFKHKVAERAGRPKQGPNGCARRKIHLLHQCYSKLLEGWNALTENVKRLQWADGMWRCSKIFLSALLGDQPELDAFTCDGSQTCKTCTCPKPKLCDTSRSYPLRSASDARNKVYRLADRGQEDLDSGKLFERDRRKDVAWKPTRRCTQTRYESARKLNGGKHLLENAFWRRRYFDVQLQVHSGQYCVHTRTFLCTYTYVFVYIHVRFWYVFDTYKYVFVHTRSIFCTYTYVFGTFLVHTSMYLYIQGQYKFVLIHF